jgi:hypothetical protein
MLFYRVLFKRCKDSTLLPNNQEKKENISSGGSK